jgi:hypothetical protein
MAVPVEILEVLGAPSSVDGGSDVEGELVVVGVTVTAGTLVAIAGAVIERVAPFESVCRAVPTVAEGMIVAIPEIPERVVGVAGTSFWRLCL